MLISVETVMPKWTGVTICLMVSFIVSTFEDMKTWLTFFGGYSGKVLVLFATSCILSMIFGSVYSIVLCISGYMRATTKC